MTKFTKKINKKDILNKVINALEISTPEDLAEMFKGLNPFVYKDNGEVYSLYNSMFLNLQARSYGLRISDVKGLKNWNEYGRQIKKGSKAVYVLAPRLFRKTEEEKAEDKKMQEDGYIKANSDIMYFFPIPVYDFEETQEMSESLKKYLTESKKLTIKEYIPATERKIKEFNLEEITKNIESNGYSLKFGYTGEAQGYIYTGSKQIQISKNLKNKNEILGVIAHELSHGEMHKDSKEVKKTKELEAEITACLVMNAFGVDTFKQSTAYAKSYNGTKEDLVKSFDKILKSADRVYKIMTGRK